MNIPQKASAVVQAWRALGWGTPSKLEVIIALLAPIGAEGNVGDTGGTWKLEGNWGSTTVRSPNAAELAAIKAAGVTPAVDKTHAQREQRARRALFDAGLPWQGLHGDSTPERPYFTFFYVADRKRGDVDAAQYYLANWRNKPGVAAAAAAGDVHGVASGMYQGRYFFGALPSLMRKEKNGTAENDATNVDRYAANMNGARAMVEAALANWDPSQPDIRAPALAPVPVPPPLGEAAADGSAEPPSPQPSSEPASPATGGCDATWANELAGLKTDDVLDEGADEDADHC